MKITCDTWTSLDEVSVVTVLGDVQDVEIKAKFNRKS